MMHTIKDQYHIIEYGNGQTDSEADEFVPIMTQDELLTMLSRKKDSDFYGQDATIGSDQWRTFDGKLINEMAKRIQPGDIVAHPFGLPHSNLQNLFPNAYHVETGIGYPNSGLRFRIFESFAWLHYHKGRANNGASEGGGNYEWVIPNYFDKDDWPYNPNPTKDYILYFGRITPEKGLGTVAEIAKRIDTPIKIVGQGNPDQWIELSGGKLQYHPPINGRDRWNMVSNALCCLMPTEYIEPFGGSGVEAMMTGVPLIASDHGAFTETVAPGVTGYRCKTLGDWIYATECIKNLDRKSISDYSHEKYTLEVCAEKYHAAFKMITGLSGEGWYSSDHHYMNLQVNGATYEA
jgi:glycosyltransferase involved in cell wall biosynthesis